MKKYIIFLMLLIVSSFSLVQAETFGYGRTETIPINYSLIPIVNNSQYFDGYSISTLYTYYKSLFDDVYCKLNGCTMTGDINMGTNDITNAGDITADNFIGDGSQLTDVWLTSTAQTGLTGNKTGSFDLTTTGIIEADNYDGAWITPADDRTKVTVEQVVLYYGAIIMPKLEVVPLLA